MAILWKFLHKKFMKVSSTKFFKQSCKNTPQVFGRTTDRTFKNIFRISLGLIAKSFKELMSYSKMKYFKIKISLS